MKLNFRSTTGPYYWITPVADDECRTAIECIRRCTSKDHLFSVSDHIHDKCDLQPGDWICFYAKKIGVVAHAQIASKPEKKSYDKVISTQPESHLKKALEEWPWVFDLKNETIYIERPVVIDYQTLTYLDAFKGRDLSKNWGWFVVTTRQILENDFKILTRQQLI